MKRNLFNQHIASLGSKQLNSLESLFETSANGLDTPFDAVYAKISSDPNVVRLSLSRANLEEAYATWQRKERMQAREDLYKLLGENAFVCLCCRNLIWG